MYENKIWSTFTIVLTEFDCPGDSTCSNQGICDDSTGTCICDVGFEGNICQGE